MKVALTQDKVFPSNNRWLTRDRLELYARAVMFTIVAIGFISMLTGPNVGGGTDYPHFYNAGKIFHDAGNQLYRQDVKEVALFPYPPFVAAVYYPLSLLDYRVSYAVYTMLMAFAVALAVCLIVHGMLGTTAPYDLAIGTALTYFPMVAAVLWGQNTAITFLLFTLVWFTGSREKEWLAGFFLGLMLYKPQFAVPLIGLHLLSGRFRTVASSMIVAAGLYLIGVCVYGPFWLSDWFNHARWICIQQTTTSWKYHISWIGFLHDILGPDSRVALIVGGTMTLGSVIAISYVWYRERRNKDMLTRFGLAAVAVLLISPHTIYYDMGLVLFTLAACLSKGVSVKIIGLMWLLSYSHLLGMLWRFSPLFVVLLVSGILAVYALRGQLRTPFSISP